MGWVDADAHVVESPLTWDYLLPSQQKFRPQLFKPEGESQRAHWVIDGKIRGLFRFTFTAEDLMKKSAQIGRDMTTTMAGIDRSLAEVGARMGQPTGDVLQRTVDSSTPVAELRAAKMRDFPEADGSGGSMSTRTRTGLPSNSYSAWSQSSKSCPWREPLCT